VLYWNKKDALSAITKSLQHDGVVLSSSDTVLGLFAQLSEIAKKKLDAIKQRNMKPYIVLISSLKSLNQFIDQDLDESMTNIMTTYWPGPLTIIFKAKSTLPDWLKSEQGTIAIRIPEHQGWQEILEHVQAVFTTSAKITDEPLPLKISDIDPRVLDQVQVVCYNQGQEVYDGKPSTILDFSTGSIRIIRHGAVVLDSI
jgi:tRNA threonylcarbamoyl adenosine modification protein (Sua5/YciO/YrdC/YwlC family)